MRSKTTFQISVNGVIHDIPGECLNREYRLTVLSTPYTGTTLPAVQGYVCKYPWVDVGYDADGNELGEVNRHITRIFSDATADKLMIGYDVFPVKYRHSFVYDAHNNLTLEYQDSIAAFPPASDGIYPSVSDRKWLLFNKSGAIKADILPPKKNNANWHRVNGLCILQA